MIDNTKEVSNNPDTDEIKSPNELPKDDKEKKKVGDSVAYLTEAELKEVQKNIEAAEKYMKAQDRWEHWEEYIDYLNCRWSGVYDDDEAWHCNVNSLYSNIQTELPTLYFQQPRTNTSAKCPTFTKKIKTPYGEMSVKVDNIQAAKLLGIRVNDVLDDADIETTTEQVITDALAPYGYGVFKIGYGFATEFDKNLEQEVTRTTYWVRRVDPRNVWIDPMASDFKLREFTVEKFVRRKSSLLKNSLYDKKKVEDMKCDIPDSLKKRFESLDGWDPKLVEFFEYHDHFEKVVRWITLKPKVMEIRKPISKKKSWIEGSDYVFLGLNAKTDDSAYPLSDIEPVIDQAVMRNRIRTQQCKHLRNWGITVFVESQFFGDELQEIKWKESGNGVIFLEVADGALQSNKMQIQNPPPISADLYNMDGVLKADNDGTLGITEAQRGQTAGDATKAEILTVANAANIRISRRRRKIKKALIEVVEKVAALIIEHDTDSTTVSLEDYANDDEFMKWVQKEYKDFNPDKPYLDINRESYQGDYLHDFEIEEMIDKPKAVQVQQLINTGVQLGGIPFLARAFLEAIDPQEYVQTILELQGLHTQKIKKHNPMSEIPPELENQLAEDGINIPPPNKKDNHARHIFMHLSLIKEMQSKLPLLFSAAVDQQTGQPKNPEAWEAYLQIKKAVMTLQNHVVLHNVIEKKESMAIGDLLGGAGQAPIGVNGPGVPQGPQNVPPPNQEGIAEQAVRPAMGQINAVQ